MLKPVGSVPGVALQVMGEFPPVEATGELYPRPMAPLGKEVVVIVKGPEIVNGSCLLAICAIGAVASVAIRVTE
jgi:hypothetical protein